MVHTMSLSLTSPFSNNEEGPHFDTTILNERIYSGPSEQIYPLVHLSHQAQGIRDGER